MSPSHRWCWLGIASIASGAILPAVFVTFPHYFSRYRGPVWGAPFITIVLVTCAAPLLLGGIALWRARRFLLSGRRLAWLGIVLGLTNCIATPVLVHLRTERDRLSYGLTHALMRCNSNLRQIGIAILLYSNDNRGQLPNRFEDLLLTQDITSHEFVCPFSNDTPARGSTTQAVAQNLSLGGHLSYVYVGQGMTTSTAAASTIVAYEHPANHAAEKLPLHVLYGDGHVGSVSERELRRLIDEVQAGHNPPRAE